MWGNPENVCLWNPQSGKLFLLEHKILGFGFRNTALGTRNPTNEWNPESNFHWQRSWIQYLNWKSGIHGVQSSIQDSLEFPRMGPILIFSKSEIVDPSLVCTQNNLWLFPRGDVQIILVSISPRIKCLSIYCPCKRIQERSGFWIPRPPIVEHCTKMKIFCLEKGHDLKAPFSTTLSRLPMEVHFLLAARSFLYPIIRG